MERTKVPNDGKILWRKTAGTFRLPDRRIVRAGDTFWATVEEIPVAFRDTIVPANQEAEDKIKGIPPEKIEAVKPVYVKKKRENSNWFDIFDAQDKQVNEKALREEQADEYLKSLNG